MNLAIAREIRATRARLRLTKEQVYTPAGLSRSSYIRYEDGARSINIANLAAICGVFGVTPAHLMASAERESPEAFNGQYVPKVVKAKPPKSPKRAAPRRRAPARKSSEPSPKPSRPGQPRSDESP